VVVASGVVTGAERIALFIAETLRADGHHVVVCLRAGPLAHEAADRGLASWILPLRSARDVRSLVRLARLLRRHRIDVVHTVNEISDVIGIGAAHLVRARSLSTQVNTVTATRSKRLVHRAIVRRATCLTAVSEALRRSWPRPGQETRLTSSQLSIPVAGDLEVERRLRAALTDVTTVGRFSPQKGIETLVEAAPELRAEGFSVRFVGDAPGGEDTDRAYRERILARNSELGTVVDVEPRTADVLSLYRSVDVLVLPSRWEGLPLTILEAMAQGVPVVASAISGVEEIVEHEVSGLLFAVGDAHGLVAAVKRLADDPNLRRSLVTEARARLTRRHAPEVVAASYRDAYRSIGITPAAS
jgi:glycosyltransferase involved in cell wall biosynthesis